MNVQIFKDYIEFAQRTDKKINGVSQQWLDDNSFTLERLNLVDCVGCWNCTHCTNCINCVNCWNCENCLNCINCQDCNYSVSLNNAIASTGCPHCFIKNLIKHFN